MATVTWTLAKGSEAGASMRKLGQRIQEMASAIPDANPTGASYVVTFDNAPSGATFSVQVTAGPITTSAYTV